MTPSAYLPKTSLQDFLQISSSVLAARELGSVLDTDAVYEQIRKVLSSPANGLHWEAIHRLWKIAEVAVHLERASAEQWHLLSVVREALRADAYCAPLAEREKWIIALRHAAQLQESNSSSTHLSINTRESVVAESLMFFEERGYEVVIDGHGARLTEKTYRAVCKKIEKHVTYAGGEFVINLLLEGMGATGSIVDGSLISARTPIHVYGRAEASPPFHFLYNIALKHLRKAERPGRRLKDTVKAELLARHLAAALDVEPHSIYENISLPSAYLEKALQEIVVYDELFGFPQWQPQSAEKLACQWIEALKGVGCVFPHADAGAWADFGKRLYGLSRRDGLVHVNRLDFGSATLQSSVAQKLFDVSSISREAIHREYATPTDTGKRTHIGYPAIRITEADYVLQPTAVAMRAFCECLCEQMRGAVRENHPVAGKNPKASLKALETKFGEALERLTASVLEDVGASITVVNGEYYGKNKGERLEIDLVVETDERIFLFECKKKALTADARSGGSLAVLGDLTNSFLHMQAQLARHEAKLRREGRIVFLDGAVLELRNRPVEKFAISLFDHGALQDRGLIIPLFERLIGCTVTSQHPAAQDILDKMNERLKILSDSVQTILDAQPEIQKDRALHGFAMSTWWLSIDQLYYLCGSGRGLWEGLRKLRYLSARSGDIIWEAHRTKHLNATSEALLNFCEKANSRAII